MRGTREAFDEVLQATVEQHGTVVGDVIDDNPLAHSSYPIDATFDGCNPLTDNRLTCEARAKQQIDQATATAQQILGGGPGAAGTDIRAGVQLRRARLRGLPRGVGAVARRAVRHGRAHAAREDAAPSMRRRAGVRRRRRRVTNHPLTAAEILDTERYWLGLLRDGRSRPDRRAVRSRACPVPLKGSPTKDNMAMVASSPQPDEDIPVSIEPIVGYRVWHLKRVNGELRLHFARLRRYLATQKVQAAVCARNRTAGFHAAPHAALLVRLLRDRLVGVSMRRERVSATASA